MQLRAGKHQNTAYVVLMDDKMIWRYLDDKIIHQLMILKTWSNLVEYWIRHVSVSHATSLHQ